MSYNKYNTRNSGRYNTPGQFVPAGELAAGGGAGAGARPLHPNNAVPPRAPQQNLTEYATQQGFGQVVNQTQNTLQQLNLQGLPQNVDVDMKTEPLETGAAADKTGERPHWMKSKLSGVKKISNKERRRRQNENLRRLLTPKNALMVLNEMMPNEQLATQQFKVEPAPATNQYYKSGSMPTFCADLTLEGNTYKGYGENKLTARNAAAEQAIRDLILKRMTKVLSAEVDTAGSQNGEGAAAGDEEALPMIQLASFALHKLFSEWEYDGHKVPQLKPNANSLSEIPLDNALPAPKSRPVKKPKELPVNASSMHPCMLLTYMRPMLEYRELAVEGDRPQNMVFTIGVDAEGATYIGKGANKKEARKAVAKAVCQALFNVQFEEGACSNIPVAPKA